MSAEPSLAGKRILVLEDDYFLAADAGQALRSAGADVVGPFPTEAAALVAIREDGINAALVDINLGPGPSFETAKALRAHAVPFVFVTGYDQAVIPREFEHVPRFEKPVQIKQIIRTVSDLTAAE